MFIWQKKLTTGAGNKSFASIARKNTKGNQMTIAFSAEFMQKFGVKIGERLVVGFDKESKRIGLNKSEDGYKLCKNGSSGTGRVAFSAKNFPFNITKMAFNDDEIFRENGIIIFELINKDIGEM